MLKIKNTETFYQLDKSPDFLRNSSFPKQRFLSNPIEHFTDGQHETCTGGEEVCTGTKGDKLFPLKCEVTPRVCVPNSAHLNKHFEEKEAGDEVALVSPLAAGTTACGAAGGGTRQGPTGAP